MTCLFAWWNYISTFFCTPFGVDIRAADFESEPSRHFSTDRTNFVNFQNLFFPGGSWQPSLIRFCLPSRAQRILLLFSSLITLQCASQVLKWSCRSEWNPKSIWLLLLLGVKLFCTLQILAVKVCVVVRRGWVLLLGEALTICEQSWAELSSSCARGCQLYYREQNQFDRTEKFVKHNSIRSLLHLLCSCRFGELFRRNAFLYLLVGCLDHMRSHTCASVLTFIWWTFFEWWTSLRVWSWYLMEYRLYRRVQSQKLVYLFLLASVMHSTWQSHFPDAMCSALFPKAGSNLFIFLIIRLAGILFKSTYCYG